MTDVGDLSLTLLSMVSFVSLGDDSGREGLLPLLLDGDLLRDFFGDLLRYWSARRGELLLCLTLLACLPGEDILVDLFDGEADLRCSLVLLRPRLLGDGDLPLSARSAFRGELLRALCLLGELHRLRFNLDRDLLRLRTSS